MIIYTGIKGLVGVGVHRHRGEGWKILIDAISHCGRKNTIYRRQKVEQVITPLSAYELQRIKERQKHGFVITTNGVSIENDHQVTKLEYVSWKGVGRMNHFKQYFACVAYKALYLK